MSDSQIQYANIYTCKDINSDRFIYLLFMKYLYKLVTMISSVESVIPFQNSYPINDIFKDKLHDGSDLFWGQ
jgi:hypothetical protein